MDQSAEGRKHLAEAVRWFRIDLRKNPNSVVVWGGLGELLRGDRDAHESPAAQEPDPG